MVVTAGWIRAHVQLGTRNVMVMSNSAGADFFPVADASDVVEGELLSVKTPSGVPVCLVKHGGELFAVSDCCTHSEFPISDGSLRPDGSLECTWHGALFDCRTGAVRKGPAEDPLPVYQVKVERGKVLVGPRKPRLGPESGPGA